MVSNSLTGLLGGFVSDTAYGAKTSGASSRWKMNRWLSRSHCSRSLTRLPARDGSEILPVELRAGRAGPVRTIEDERSGLDDVRLDRRCLTCP